MATDIDREKVRAAYEDVRDDNSETSWAVFKYEATNITLDSSGTQYEEFQEKFSDGERAFGFVRLILGDELSKRAKFALITWIGGGVSPLQRAKVTADQALVKSIVKNFAVEVQASEADEIELGSVRELLAKAGGANYGTGERKSVSK